MLRAAVPVAYALGIDPALLTVDRTNVASRTVIERVGGILDDGDTTKLRYWLPTSVTPGP
jgi:predicted acetyltransferase